MKYIEKILSRLVVNQTSLSKKCLRNAVGISVGLVVWELVYWATEGRGFAHFWEVGLRIAHLTIDFKFWISIFATAGLALGGLAGGVMLAVLIGVPLAVYRRLERELRWVLLFARAIPSVALLPLLMASMGSRGALVSIFVVWLVAIKMVFFVIRGVRDVDRPLAEQAKLLQLSPTAQIVFLRIPSASSVVLMGTRLSVGLAYGSVVLAGLLAGTPGLGRDISFAAFSGETESVLSYTVISGYIGVALFTLLRKIEHRLVFWRNVA